MLLDKLIRFVVPFLKLLPSRSFGLWVEGLYWSYWLTTAKSKVPEIWQKRLDPNEPLADSHCRFIEHLSSCNIRILDVGAGPFTDIGKKHPSKTLEIVATDVLAEKYAKLLKRKRIIPPVKTIYADAEHLTKHFPAMSFDYVSATNSIDHCADPVRAIKEMLAVVRPGCYVNLVHCSNEAEHASYAGLHQWNFTEENGHFIIWNKHVRIDLTNELAPQCQVDVCVEERYVHVHLRKNTLPLNAISAGTVAGSCSCGLAHSP